MDLIDIVIIIICVVVINGTCKDMLTELKAIREAVESKPRIIVDIRMSEDGTPELHGIQMEYREPPIKEQ